MSDFIVMLALLTSTSRPPRNSIASCPNRAGASLSRKVGLDCRRFGAVSRRACFNSGQRAFTTARVVEDNVGSFPAELKRQLPYRFRFRSQ